MAKYTETLLDYLEGGGTLPAVFEQIQGFNDLFISRYCDSEIGFETEDLFKIKLESRAQIIIPAYVKRIAATEAAWLTVENPTRTQERTTVIGERTNEITSLPLNFQTAVPSQTGKADPSTDTDTIVNSGATVDESIRRAQYFQNLTGTAWILLDACLKEFESMFMGVY